MVTLAAVESVLGRLPRRQSNAPALPRVPRSPGQRRSTSLTGDAGLLVSPRRGGPDVGVPFTSTTPCSDDASTVASSSMLAPPAPVLDRSTSDSAYYAMSAASGFGTIRAPGAAPNGDTGIRGWLGDEWVGGDRRPRLGDGMPLDGSNYTGPGALFLQGWSNWMPEESRVTSMSHASQRLLSDDHLLSGSGRAHVRPSGSTNRRRSASSNAGTSRGKRQPLSVTGSRALNGT
mmetsp:Transcript_5705/g.10153  ORF Transcript_5705/g.10153 Transcript_5705/m.10153 type:complete len:232 (-) Transcript_5705:58-753(-)